jgi:serine protease Do
MIGQTALVLSMILATLATDKEPVGPAEQAALLDALTPSLVKVEYSLQYDKGEPPKVRGCAERCPNCGNYHINNADQLVREERPLESAGFLLSPTQVLTADPLAHPRFVKGISVRFGKTAVKAKIAGYAKDQNAVFLELGEPLAGAKPLTFNAAKTAPYLAVTYQNTDGEWAVDASPLTLSVTTTESKRRFCDVPSRCLIVAKDGTPVAACMKEEVPPDDTWKGSPQNWPTVSADEMTALLKSLEERCNRSLLRVALSFRSPKAQAQQEDSYSGREEEEDPNATERSVTGVLLDTKRVLVLAQLPPKVTARLERIVVHPGQGKPVQAKFTATLSDYGCLLATLESPVEGAASFSRQPILDFRNVLLLSAEISMKGESRVGYYCHDRLASFDTGWKQRVYPDMAGDMQNGFLFDSSFAMVAMPIARRDKVTVREDWSARDVQLTPVAYIQETLANLTGETDPNNVPLSEEEENRLAWMGVELQALNRELARANSVSDLTGDGRSGALVTFVHPNSPAAKAGIAAGDILLRLHIEGHPKPFEVKLSDDRFSGGDSYPWDRLDEVPAEYLDQLPRPWPNAENTFTRALTDLGFGKKYTAEFFHDGQVIRKDFEVAMSPPHFDAAPRYKSEPMGMTVRDVTYEVRRYFQKKNDDPGVIVSKIEPGGKAAVAGLIPYEIITHVNDNPVMNVKDFEKLIADQKQLRLSVSRKTQGRIVKIDMTAPAGGKGLMNKLRSSLRRGRPGAGPTDTAPAAQTQPQP